MISEFVISAVEKEQWPESDLPEVVVVDVVMLENQALLMH